MRIYLATLKNRFMAERMAREELERRKVLVNKQHIVDYCRRLLDAVLKRLRRLPDETGPQCNPRIRSWDTKCSSARWMQFWRLA